MSTSWRTPRFWCQDVEDARQEAFLEAVKRGDLGFELYQELERTDGTALIAGSRLWRLQRNVLRRQRRTAGRRPGYVSISQIGDIPCPLNPPDIAAAEHAERAELQAAVARVMKRLVERDAAILRLHYFESFTLRQVAEAIGCRETTVRKALQRARDRARALFARNAYGAA